MKAEPGLKEGVVIPPRGRRASCGGGKLEGNAVLLMLIATRSNHDAQDAVGLTWIEANRSIAPPAERKGAKEAVERQEKVASRMAHRFTVHTIAGLPVVKLIGLRITPEVPVRSTVWSLSWPDRDAYARDRFYLWLLERIDRWDDWSHMVTSHGPRVFTEHLLRLAFCDRIGRSNGESGQ